MRIGKWPSGWYEPERSIECPAEILQGAEEELIIWKLQTEQRRVRAWIEWHEENGWPEDELYQTLLLLELKGVYRGKITIRGGYGAL
jgi:hypothetical protein